MQALRLSVARMVDEFQILDFKEPGFKPSWREMLGSVRAKVLVGGIQQKIDADRAGDFCQLLTSNSLLVLFMWVPCLPEATVCVWGGEFATAI